MDIPPASPRTSPISTATLARVRTTPPGEAKASTAEAGASRNGRTSAMIQSASASPMAATGARRPATKQPIRPSPNTRSSGIPLAAGGASGSEADDAIKRTAPNTQVRRPTTSEMIKAWFTAVLALRKSTLVASNRASSATRSVRVSFRPHFPQATSVTPTGAEQPVQGILTSMGLMVSNSSPRAPRSQRTCTGGVGQIAPCASKRKRPRCGALGRCPRCVALTRERPPSHSREAGGGAQ